MSADPHPHPTTQRATWRAEHLPPSPALPEPDLQALLNAARARNDETPFAVLASDPSSTGTAVRIEATPGLTERTHRAITTILDAHLTPHLLIPLARAHDLVAVKEGRTTLDPSALAPLIELERAHPIPLGLLLDPTSIYHQTLAPPIWAIKDTIDQARAHNLDLNTTGAPLAQALTGSIAARWDLIWIQRQTQPDGHTLRPLLQATNPSLEWSDPGLGDRDTFDLPRIDPLTHIDARLIERSTDPSNTPTHIPRLTLHTNVDALITSAPDPITPWRLVNPHGALLSLTTQQAVARLESLPTNSRIAICIDPAHLAPKPTHTPSPIRALPYPFQAAIAISSDADGATPHQTTRIAHEVTHTHGLPIALSAFLRDRSPTWTAWSRTAHQPTNLPDTPHLLDTVHGLTESADPVEFTPDTTHWSDDHTLTLHFDPPISRHDALVITTHHTTNTPRATAILQHEHEFELPTPTQRHDEPTNRTHTRIDLLDHSASPIVAIRISGLDRAAFITAHTAVSTTPAVEQALTQLADHDLHPPVYTWHGGSEDTRRFSALFASNHLDKQPTNALHALDRPTSPFYALPHLKSAGLKFFNIPGRFVSATPLHITKLLSTDTAQDGSPIWTFWRFRSQRWTHDHTQPRWSHGKAVASADALGASVSDLITQLTHRPPGACAIIYTHLADRTGPQLNERLGWTEETHNAFAQLAHHHFEPTDHPPLRIWSTTTASLLTYAALRASIEDHTTITDNTVEITSWNAPEINASIPDPQTHGTSWLHNLTLHVPDPTRANVLVDNHPVTSFTHNPPDETGQPSITLIDTNERVPLIPSAHSCTPIDNPCANITDPSPTHPTTIDLTPGTAHFALHPVNFANTTHLRLETKAPDNARFTVEIKAASGWITLGTTPTVQRLIPPSNPDTWTEHTLSFTHPTYQSHRAKHTPPPMPPPRARATEIRITTDSPLALRAIEFIRPRPGSTKRPTRIITGSARTIHDTPIPNLPLTIRAGATTIETQTDEQGRFRARTDYAVRGSIETTPPARILDPRAHHFYTTTDITDLHLTIIT